MSNTTASADIKSVNAEDHVLTRFSLLYPFKRKMVCERFTQKSFLEENTKRKLVGQRKHQSI